MSHIPGPVPDSYWVIPGRLLAGEYPGSRDPDDARERLGRFRRAGVDFFLDLTEPGELVPYEGGLASSDSRIEYRRFAVVDLQSPSFTTMQEILNVIDDALLARRTVYVHCWGGVGRTGTVIGCHLMRHGMKPDDAVAAIAEWRRGTPDGHRVSPETPEQRRMVASWTEPKPWWARYGWAERGSQLQVQLYVNRRTSELNATVAERIPALRGLTWRAPLETNDFHEPRDAEFLEAIDLSDHLEGLKCFWPAGGPVWDALAVRNSAKPCSLLVEAKSHPQEVYGPGTKATSEASVRKIASALEKTQTWLGLEPVASRWMKPLRPEERGYSSVYQSANRLAHLYWLRNVIRTEAWLAHLLFVDDPTYGCTSRGEWEGALPAIEADLGLSEVDVPYATRILLCGLDPESVLGFSSNP